MVENNIGKLFLEATSADNSPMPVHEAGDIPPAMEKSLPAGSKMIMLPEPELLPDKEVNFLELIEVRSTVRQYSNRAYSLKELSYLLWCTQGVKMSLPNGTSKRTVPSAGGRHALETYLLINRVEGLQPGLYRFLAFEHALTMVTNDADQVEAFIAGFKAQNMVRSSAVTFLWGAEIARMLYKFGPRGYRYLYLDAGHVCENLYLAGQTLGIGVCAVGMFYDDKLNAALNFDGENEFAVYGAITGKY